VLVSLGRILLVRGRAEDAELAGREAERIFGLYLEEGDDRLALPRTLTADALRAQGRGAEADLIASAR